MALELLLWLLIAAARPHAPDPPPLPPIAAAASSAEPGIQPPPPPPRGGSPVRPDRLPPARTCREALQSVKGDDQALPGQIDGARVGGANGLRMLRAAWGDALVVIRDGDFSSADLGGARLHNICFVGSKLARSRWRGAEADGIGFLHSDLTGADFRRATMRQAIFRSSALEAVDATGADLSDGLVDGGGLLGTLRNLRLDRADLSGFRFDCGIVSGEDCGSREGVSFRGTRLARARVDIFFEADWTDAVLDRTEIMPEQLLELGAARLAGTLRVRGGDRVVSLAPSEYARLRSHLSAPREVVPPDEAAAKQRRPAWFRPGARAVFIEPRIEFDQVARAGPLYARLLPVLIASARGSVLVKVDGADRISVRGEAIGGNAHMCSLAADGLRYDRASGWFTGPQEPSSGDPPEWRGKPMPVLLLWNERAQVFQDGHGGGMGSDPRPSVYAMCGPRAGFRQMVQVPSDAPEAQRLCRDWGRYD